MTSFTALMNNRRLDAKHCDDNILLGTLALNSLDELKSRDASKFVVVAPSRRRSVSCALKPGLQTLHPTIGWECTTQAIKMLTCDAVTCFFLPFLTLPELWILEFSTQKSWKNPRWRSFWIRLEFITKGPWTILKVHHSEGSGPILIWCWKGKEWQKI